MSNEISNALKTVKLWVVSVIVPALGLLITGVIFIIRADDKLTTIAIRQDKLEDKVDHVSTRVDTIERRQAIYQATHP